MAREVKPHDNSATLVAIMLAAHKTRNLDLERSMRQRLLDEHGIKLVFAKNFAPVKGAERG